MAYILFLVGGVDGADGREANDQHNDDDGHTATLRKEVPWHRMAVVDSDDTVSLVEGVGFVVAVVVEGTASPRVPWRLRECRRLTHNNHTRRILSFVLA